MPLSRLVATWFGTGLLPRAPGTFGTLAAVPVVLALWVPGSPWPPLLGAAVLTALGVAAADLVARRTGVEDAGEIVIDEVAGFAVACAFARPTAPTLVAAFAVFRALDVLKPWPLSALERLPRGFGVMADDVAAGLATALLVQGGALLLGLSS